MKRTKLQQEYNRLWHYISHLKEGGKAWERATDRLVEIKQELERNNKQ